MQKIKILDSKVKANDLKSYADEWYPNFLKGCVDLANQKVAVGGEYHIESAQVLVSAGGKGADIWGFNLRFSDTENIVEYDSMVNIKPKINNGRVISDENLKTEVRNVIEKFIEI